MPSRLLYLAALLLLLGGCQTHRIEDWHGDQPKEATQLRSKESKTQEYERFSIVNYRKGFLGSQSFVLTVKNAPEPEPIVYTASSFHDVINKVEPNFENKVAWSDRVFWASIGGILLTAPLREELQRSKSVGTREAANISGAVMFLSIAGVTWGAQSFVDSAVDDYNRKLHFRIFGAPTKKDGWETAAIMQFDF